MKVGVRKPSIKKSISARTTGRAKRAVKKAVIPGYGRRGAGWVKNPKRAIYNKMCIRDRYIPRQSYNGTVHCRCH